MKRIIFVRHGKSSWKNPDQSDFERALNERGERDVEFMSELLSKKVERPELFISSPAIRTKLTALAFANAFGINEEEVHFNEGIYERGGKYIISLLKELDNNYNSIIIFGHNPDMTSLSSYFTGEYFDNVPTCGIVAVDFECDEWKNIENKNGKLLFFEYPKQYF